LREDEDTGVCAHFRFHVADEPAALEVHSGFAIIESLVGGSEVRAQAALINQTSFHQILEFLESCNHFGIAEADFTSFAFLHPIGIVTKDIRGDQGDSWEGTTPRFSAAHQDRGMSRVFDRLRNFFKFSIGGGHVYTNLFKDGFVVEHKRNNLGPIGGMIGDPVRHGTFGNNEVLLQIVFIKGGQQTRLGEVGDGDSHENVRELIGGL